MKNQNSRRNFMKSMLVVQFVASVPLATSGISPFISSVGSSSKKYGHKFKTALNAFSIKVPLLDKKIDLFDVLDYCVEYNVDAIDPIGYFFPGYPEVPSDEYINRFKRKAFLLGIDICGTGVKNNLATPDEASRKADVKMIKDWTVAAAKLGAPVLRLFAGENEHEGFSRDQVYEWIVKDLKECCEFGKRHGVIIGLQVHNDFLLTADDVDRMFEMVDSEWLGLIIDTGHYRVKDPYAEIEQNIKHTVSWQIKEEVYRDGKTEPINYVKLFEIMKKAGYRGYVPVLTMGPGNEFKRNADFIDSVRKAIQIVES
jgi:sugar phosphate isomerase/epimerase